MTTSNPPPAPENGQQLTALNATQLQTLKAVAAIFPQWAQEPIASEETWHALHKLGLIWWDSFKHQILITDAGFVALGLPVSPQAAGEKPPVIDAATFVREHYEAKIERGECVVPYPYEADANVLNIYEPTDWQKTESRYRAEIIDKSGLIDTPLPDNIRLTVTWLPANGLPVPVGGESAEAGWYFSSVVQWIPEYSESKINGYTGPFPTWQDALEVCFKELDDDMNRIRDQRQELRVANERLSAQLAALTDALKAEKDRRLAYGIALEKIASKSDVERPKKWDAEMDTSFGITLGWWSAGVIAREVLAATGQPADGSHDVGG